MTFLNPFVLFGLAAAAIPILIHLFNVRKLRTIEFSTLTFLKELNKNKIRRIKVRQWLLLALRTLLILLVVLAFSRPALHGSFGTAGSRASSTVVILLDNSASMQLHDEQGKYIAQAQQKAMEIIGTLQENDDAFFLRLSDLPLATTEEPTRDRQRLSTLIAATEVSYRSRSIEEGLRVSARLLQQSHNLNKEVYILTDGQRSTLLTGGEQRSAAERLFEPSVKLFYLPFAHRAGENIAVEQTVIPPSLMRAGKPFQLQVTVKNHGTAPVQNHLVTVTLEGQTVMQKSVSLAAGERSVVEFPVIPPHAGYLSGFARTEDDEYEADDRCYFSFFVPPQVNVALVASDKRYARYLSAALNAVQGTGATPVSLQSVTPSQLSSNLLSGVQVLLFAGVAELPAASAEMVTQFVRSGGGLLFFPSAESSAVRYNYLGTVGVPPLRFVTAGASFDKVDLQFPVFQGMFDQAVKTKTLSVESPQVTRSAAPEAAASLRQVITLSNGMPFLWQTDAGRGKVLGIAVPATTEWSDLPMKGFFVPLVFQSVLYLASPAATAEEQQYLAGERIEFSSANWRRNSTVSAAAVKMFDAERRAVPLQSYVRSGIGRTPETMFIVEQTEQPGIYSALVQRDTAMLMAVNVRREESTTELSGSSDLAGLRERLSIIDDAIITLKPESDLQQTVSESRFGVELWRYFLLAAVLVALIEMFIAREPKQEP